GIEILGKAAWTLNSHLLSGSYQRSSFGHRLTSLLDSLDTQAVILSRPTTCSGQTIRTIAEVAEQFAMGGRFAATDGLFSGEDFSPPYLWWCGVQIETARTSGRKLADAEYYIYCRRHHTLALQLLDRKSVVEGKSVDLGGR